jgi:hypothetical protein
MVQEIAIHYVDEGAGRPVVLVHGTSSAWYDELWSRREAIRCVPALLLFPTADHFVREEARDALGAVLREYLKVGRAH